MFPVLPSGQFRSLKAPFSFLLLFGFSLSSDVTKTQLAFSDPRPCVTSALTGLVPGSRPSAGPSACPLVMLHKRLFIYFFMVLLVVLCFRCPYSHSVSRLVLMSFSERCSHHCILPRFICSLACCSTSVLTRSR